MSYGTAPFGLCFSVAKANFALGSINFRMNQALITRSIPGRGRVTQVLFRYEERDTVWNSEDRNARVGCSSAAKLFSTCSRRGLPKKSIEAISWKRRRSLVGSG